MKSFLKLTFKVLLLSMLVISCSDDDDPVTSSDCTVDADCLDGETCNDGVCVANTATVQHCGNISTDETWSAADEHILTCQTFVEDGVVELYHNGTKKFETTSDGVTISSTDATNVDGPIVKLTRDSASPAVNDILGSVRLLGKNDADQDVTYAEIDSIIFDETDGTENGALRFTIPNNGTQTVYLTLGDEMARFQQDARFDDDVKAYFGTGNDLEIYHDGSNSFISDTGTGDLVIEATHLRLRSASAETYFLGTANGSVELYHNNVKKFETTSDGATITGNATITSTANNGPVLNLISDDPSDVADFGTEGSIVYKAENDASQVVEYANIKLLTDDVSDGTEDGRIRCMVSKAGTITDVFDITSSAVQIRQGQPLTWQNAGGSGVNLSLAIATPSSSKTITLPDATGTVLTTGNSDTPTTTTSSSDADFVLVDDGGTMKKITPSNLGITSGGASKGFAVAMAIAL